MQFERDSTYFAFIFKIPLPQFLLLADFLPFNFQFLPRGATWPRLRSTGLDIVATGKVISSPITAQFLTKSHFSDSLSKTFKLFPVIK